MTLLTVVIPALDAAKTIGRQLDALARQCDDVGSGRWELVVADNGSTDQTAELVASYSHSLPVAVADASARRGASAARNIGAQRATGRVVVFTDADDVVADGWLAAWEQWAVSSPSNGIAAGVILHEWNLSSGTHAPDHPCRTPRQMGLPYAGGSSLGMHTDLFHRLGGFDESRLTGEDIDISWRALAAGAHIDCVRAYVQVAADRRGAALLRRYYQYGLGDPPLYRDHRDLGASREPIGRLVRTYAGLLARVPLLHDRAHRERWLRQLGRRTGRLVGSTRCRTWLP